MKKSLLKIVVPTLALGLVFAPISNAEANYSSSKTVILFKADSKSKEIVIKLSSKEKEAVKKLASIPRNISKVEASVKQLSTATTNFYAKALITPVSAHAEANFYASTAGKLKANSNQLKALKKQVDHVAKKHMKSDSVSAVYKKIAELNTSITIASKNLNELHTQFKAQVSEQEAKEKFTEISTNLSKVEASIAEVSKATVDFYAKAAVDSTVTAKMEAVFYVGTSGKVKANTYYLQTLKKQLDNVAKVYKDTVAIADAQKKITDLTSANSLVSKTLNDLHTQFVAKVNEQEAKEQFASIISNISKVEVSLAESTKAIVDFYAKAAVDATVTAKMEADFYSTTSSKLKSTTTQLQVLTKQLENVAKVYKDTAAIAATQTKIASLNTAVTATSKSLSDLHTQFLAKQKEQEAKLKLAPIINNIVKVETSMSELTKAITDFYVKAATDSTITAQVEADFYKKASGSLLTSTKDLLVVKGQLDSFVKTYGQSADTLTAYSKISAQNQAIVLTVDALTKYHTNFKPVTPPTTKP